MTASPAHPPPPNQAPPTGWLDVTLQGNRFFSGIVVPEVRLNGHLVPSRYGQNVYPVPPGPWHVDVVGRWWKTYGQASLTCEVPLGGTVPVFYAAPPNVFSRGNIGHVKQKTPGLWFYWALGALFLIPLLILLVVALVV